MSSLSDLCRRSEAYRLIFEEGILPPKRERRTSLCIHLGKLTNRVSICTGNNFHRCDLLGGETYHNGLCQRCGKYDADDCPVTLERGKVE